MRMIDTLWFTSIIGVNVGDVYVQVQAISATFE
jgi:hypothetical protein